MTDIPLNRGSDLAFTGVWRDATGAAVNLAGWSIEVFEPSNFPAGSALAVSWSNAPQGAYAASLQWSDDMPTGRLMSFRLRVRNNGVELSTPMIWIVVK